MKNNLQQDLINKLHKQSDLGEIDVTSGTTTPQQNFGNNQPPLDWGEKQNDQLPTEEVIETNSSNPGLKTRIQEIEEQLGESTKSISTITAKAKVFLDEYGDETFYVNNQSNGHLAISDLDIVIKRARCEDLLKFANLEDIKKSRDIRAMLSEDSARALLKRLTPEEYLIKKEKELNNKQQIDAIKSNQPQIQQPQAQPVTPRIRPTILSKLEKLRLSTVPENAHLGMTPIEFTEWALTENLSIEELDYVTTHPYIVNNTQIRKALYEKRGTMSV